MFIDEQVTEVKMGIFLIRTKLKFSIIGKTNDLKNYYRSDCKSYFEFLRYTESYTVPTHNFDIFVRPKSVTILGNVTIWVIEGFRIEGIDSSIRIGLFV